MRKRDEKWGEKVKRTIVQRKETERKIETNNKNQHIKSRTARDKREITEQPEKKRKYTRGN